MPPAGEDGGVTPSSEEVRARLLAADHGVLSTFDPDRGLHAVSTASPPIAMLKLSTRTVAT